MERIRHRDRKEHVLSFSTSGRMMGLRDRLQELCGETIISYFFHFHFIDMIPNVIPRDVPVDPQCAHSLESSDCALYDSHVDCVLFEFPLNTALLFSHSQNYGNRIRICFALQMTYQLWDWTGSIDTAFSCGSDGVL